MEWFRTYNGTSTDPKWLVIARAAGTIPGVVASVWGALLDHASQNTPRGSIRGFDVEVIAAFYGYELATVEAVLEVMRTRGMITEEDALAAWSKRQPKREDGSAERARAWREKKANATEPTDPNPNGRRTHANATERSRTPEREKRERRESTTGTLTNVSGAASAPAEVDRADAETVETLMPLVRTRLRLGGASRAEQSRDLKHLRQLSAAGVPVSSLRTAIENAAEMRDRGALIEEGVRPLSPLGVRWLAHVPGGGGPSNWQRATEWDLETFLDRRRRESMRVA